MTINKITKKEIDELMEELEDKEKWLDQSDLRYWRAVCVGFGMALDMMLKKMGRTRNATKSERHWPAE